MKKMGIVTLCAFMAAGSVLYAQERKSKRERQQEEREKVQKMVHAQEYKFVDSGGKKGGVDSADCRERDATAL